MAASVAIKCRFIMPQQGSVKWKENITEGETRVRVEYYGGERLVGL